MLNFSFVKIEGLVIHKVGNKLNDEGIGFSNNLCKTEGIEDLLLNFYLKNFKSELYYEFDHGTALDLNLIYSRLGIIFNKIDGALIDFSMDFARHLYDISIHPKIKSGELHVVYLRDVYLDGDSCDAIGIFKTDTKENGFEFDLFSGLSDALPHKFYTGISKGAIICNFKDGYKVAVFEENTKNGGYWINEFLQLSVFQNDYTATRDLLHLCKKFVFDHLPTQFEVEAKDQAGILNKLENIVKNSGNYEAEAFANDVFEQPEIIEEFKNFKATYEDFNDVVIPDTFDINDTAVKQASSSFKTVLKLDKNFHIYLHGDQKLIEKGKDEELGMNYYKLYFNNEQ